MSEDDKANEASGLRAQIEELQAELKEYRERDRTDALTEAFKDFGLDPEKGPGKFTAASYKGQPDADAVRDWLQSEGFEPSGSTSEEKTTTEEPTGLTQRQEQQRNLQQLRDASESGTDQKVTSTEFMQIAKSDPAKARQLLGTPGAVELKHSSA